VFTYLANKADSDLGSVFSKDKASSLPPHRPYNCSINLLPGAPLPTSRLYNLSRPERESMEVYIRDYLAAGIIRPSSSPVGAGFYLCTKERQLIQTLHWLPGLKSDYHQKQIYFVFNNICFWIHSERDHLFQARPPQRLSLSAHLGQWQTTQVCLRFDKPSALL